MESNRSLFLGVVLAVTAAISFAQTPSAAAPGGGDIDSVPQHRDVDSSSNLQSARSFDGIVVRTGRQFVLKNSVAHTSYKLDDQKKAREYEGRRVKVTATMDADTSVLHVIDINESSHTRH
jgi:Protein of unknown function (DUF5818)